MQIWGGGYLNYFPNSRCCDLYINVGGYFELFFVMAEVGNLHANLGVTLCIFIMAVVGNFLNKLR